MYWRHGKDEGDDDDDGDNDGDYQKAEVGLPSSGCTNSMSSKTLGGMFLYTAKFSQTSPTSGYSKCPNNHTGGTRH